jgi:hypothetical protein
MYPEKRGDYFLRIAAAASREMPIAARIVAAFTGDFFVTPAAAPGACACAGGAADDPDWWRQ